MSKRKVAKPLNLDNLDEDSEPEEMGSFTPADEETRKNRVIKVAKRRLKTTSGTDGVFSSLKPSFSLNSQSSANLASTFSFLKNSPANSSSPFSINSNGASTKLEPSKSETKKPINTLLDSSTPIQVEPKFAFKRHCTDEKSPSSPKSSVSPVVPKASTNGEVKCTTANGDQRVSCARNEPSQEDYLSNPILERVKILNAECLQWAQQHIDENPLIDLRPVFNDYFKHFEAIIEEYHKSETHKTPEMSASSEILTKLQNHIRNKNSLDNKSLERKGLESSSVSKDILSPELNAEMKSKITHHLNRLSYFSSMLASKNDGEETKIPETSKNEDSSVSAIEASKGNKQVVTSIGSPLLGSKAGSTPVSSPLLGSSGESKSEKTILTENSLKSSVSPASMVSNTFSFSKSNVSSNFSLNSTASENKKRNDEPADSGASAKTSESSSFFQIPALRENCFSNPSLLNKDSPFSSPTQPSPFSSASPFGTDAFSKPSNTINFGAVSQQAVSTPSNQEEEAEDEPPVVHVEPIVEEGAKYSTRCKVFVKKEDNSYADKGVGTLSLKTLEDSGKSQLVVRTETALGNILVNLVLSKDIPIQRTGKNNVLLVCLPTPEYEPPPKVVLLRVKTGAEADELCKVLKENQV